MHECGGGSLASSSLKTLSMVKDNKSKVKYGARGRK